MRFVSLSLSLSCGRAGGICWVVFLFWKLVLLSYWECTWPMNDFFFIAKLDPLVFHSSKWKLIRYNRFFRVINSYDLLELCTIIHLINSLFSLLIRIGIVHLTISLPELMFILSAIALIHLLHNLINQYII